MLPEMYAIEPTTVADYLIKLCEGSQPECPAMDRDLKINIIRDFTIISVQKMGITVE